MVNDFSKVRTTDGQNYTRAYFNITIEQFLILNVDQNHLMATMCHKIR